MLYFIIVSIIVLISCLTSEFKIGSEPKWKCLLARHVFGAEKHKIIVITINDKLWWDEYVHILEPVKPNTLWEFK